MILTKASGMPDLRELLPKIKSRYEQRNSGGTLLCRQGFHKDCAVLKLQKTSWTNDSFDRIQNESGIFFSIWVNADDFGKGRVNYNIHALKLRKLIGYSIASRDFAADFRDRFASVGDCWPNVSVNYGPLTLMQGWSRTNLEHFEEDALVLMERFKDLSPLIDRLLESRRRNVSVLLPAAASP